MTEKLRILIVDDEVFNLDILETILHDAGFDVSRAEDGEKALAILHNDSAFDLIILDRMMPKMNGIDVLKSVKSDTRLGHIPVIMQTADGRNAQILEGIRSGAYYYLVKPFDEALLLSIVFAALKDHRLRKEMREQLYRQKHVVRQLDKAQFHFRTLEDAACVACFVAHFCPDPTNAVYGLNELMVNAIEHGNLEMPYEYKPRLMVEKRWHAEVERYLAMPEHAQKHAFVTLQRYAERLEIAITDQGKGFAWKKYLDFDPMRMTEPQGRGIAMARTIAFPTLSYRDQGRTAVCTVPLV